MKTMYRTSAATTWPIASRPYATICCRPVRIEFMNANAKSDGTTASEPRSTTGSMFLKMCSSMNGSRSSVTAIPIVDSTAARITARRVRPVVRPRPA